MSLYLKYFFNSDFCLWYMLSCGTSFPIFVYQYKNVKWIKWRSVNSSGLTTACFLVFVSEKTLQNQFSFIIVFLILQNSIIPTQMFLPSWRWNDNETKLHKYNLINWLIFTQSKRHVRVLHWRIFSDNHLFKALYRCYLNRTNKCIKTWGINTDLI